MRPIGLGITNLGAYLIQHDWAYDSEQGREEAKYLMQFITSCAMEQSIKLAKKLGPYPAMTEESKETVRNILLVKTKKEYRSIITSEFFDYGIRNSQLTTAAPCGTISLMMDCETTGIEPLFALSTTKNLVGGGQIITETKCTGRTSVTKTANEIHWKDHILMVAALQDGISSGISKTINMPNDVTVEDVEEAFMFAWKNRLKGVTVYRDGSKGMQPLQDTSKIQTLPVIKEADVGVSRRKLPDTRESITHKFDINGFEGYITVGLYEDKVPGEVFIAASNSGETMNGLLDAFATSISLSLQYGVPLEKLIEKFKRGRFEPAGITSNPDVPMCSSVINYIFKWLEFKFITQTPHLPSLLPPAKKTYDGPPCSSCGGMTQKSGSCYCCLTCGSTTGCS